MSTANTAHGEELNYINCEKGLWSWWMTIDHKRLGLMYLASILIFFFLGGAAALMVRVELTTPKADKLVSSELRESLKAAEAAEFALMEENSDPAAVKEATAKREQIETQVDNKAKTNYNKAFTAHGVIMIFLFIVPGIPATLGNFLLPLMLGAKDVAFPKLNRHSFWVYCLGSLVATAALFYGIDTGWTFYAPYSIQESKGVLLITLAAFILGFSSIMTGVNFLVTIHKMRAPGLTWDKLPLFVWTMYATSILQVVATPVVGITLLLLIGENVTGIGVFDPKAGGDPVLFEHLFWFYSHPVVYIMILPAMGIVSEIIPVFSRKPIFGYTSIVFASVGIAAIALLVWGHHMFVAGMSNAARYIFSFLTFFVAVPTAIKVFNWICTMYKGSIHWDTPMLYAMSFVFLFMIAGTTGVHLATLATDAHYHDTYFVVAHFHYTIQGGAVIGLVAGLHYWFPKMFGKMYHQNVAKFGWLILFIGFNGTFLPQFILGMEGMPRRYASYPEEYESLHALSTKFAMFNGLGYALVFGNLFVSIFNGKKCSANPWRALTLEWQAASPPIHENFETIPTVSEGFYGYDKEMDKKFKSTSSGGE